jgi:hypothetical protein
MSETSTHLGVWAAATVAAIVSMALGAMAMCLGTFLAFPLVISVLLYPVGLRPNAFAVFTMVGGLFLEVIGLGLILVGPRLWSRVGTHGIDQAGSNTRDSPVIG